MKATVNFENGLKPATNRSPTPEHRLQIAVSQVGGWPSPSQRARLSAQILDVNTLQLYGESVSRTRRLRRAKFFMRRPGRPLTLAGAVHHSLAARARVSLLQQCRTVCACSYEPKIRRLPLEKVELARDFVLQQSGILHPRQPVPPAHSFPDPLALIVQCMSL